MHPYLTIVSHIYIIYPCSPTTKPHAPSPLKKMCLRGSTATARASASRWALSSAQLRNGCRASSPMLGEVRIMLGDRRCAVGLGQPFQVAYNEIFKVQYYVSIYIYIMIFAMVKSLWCFPQKRGFSSHQWWWDDQSPPHFYHGTHQQRPKPIEMQGLGTTFRCQFGYKHG
jgi:hypothetical protein